MPSSHQWARVTSKWFPFEFPLKVSFSCCVMEFFLSIVTPGLLKMHCDNVYYWRCSNLNKLNWIWFQAMSIFHKVCDQVSCLLLILISRLSTELNSKFGSFRCNSGCIHQSRCYFCLYLLILCASCTVMSTVCGVLWAQTWLSEA